MIYEAHVYANEDESYYFICGKDEDGADVYWDIWNRTTTSKEWALSIKGAPQAGQFLTNLVTHGWANREAYAPRRTDYGHGVVVERLYKYASIQGIRLFPKNIKVTETTDCDDTKYWLHVDAHQVMVDKEQYVALKAFIEGEVAEACEGLKFHDAVKTVSFYGSGERMSIGILNLHLRRLKGRYFAGNPCYNEIDALTYELLNRVLDDWGEE
jgi:hypothetical protein